MENYHLGGAPCGAAVLDCRPAGGDVKSAGIGGRAREVAVHLNEPRGAALAVGERESVMGFDGRRTLAVGRRRLG